jgi:hypothetical protein
VVASKLAVVGMIDTYGLSCHQGIFNNLDAFDKWDRGLSGRTLLSGALEWRIKEIHVGGTG